jgi:glycosyltransferase 2 family protein
MNVKTIISIIVSIIIVIVLLTFVNVSEIIENIISFGIVPFLIANVVFSLIYIVRAIKWRLIIQPIAPVSFSKTFMVLVLGFFVNNFFPARLGEIVRAILLSKYARIGKSISLSTVVVDRITDTFGLLVLFFIAVLFIPSIPPEINAAALVLLVVLVGVLVVFLAKKKLQGVFRPFLFWLPLKGKQFLHDLGIVIQSLKNPRSLVVWAVSILTWALYIPLYQFILGGLGISLGLLEVLVLIAIVSLSSFIPASPGYIGTFEGAAVLALQLFGVDITTAVTFAIIAHATVYVSTTFLGLVSLNKLALNWSDLKTASQESRE